MQPTQQKQSDFPGEIPTNRVPIVLIGASVRAVAESAALAGFDIFGVDHFGDRDAQAACSGFQTFSQLSKSTQVLQEWIRLRSSAPVEIVHAGGVIGQASLIEQIEKMGQRLGPSNDTRSRLEDTSLLASVAKDSGVGFPTVEKGGLESSGLADLESSPWLVKRMSSSGGLGVQWATRGHTETSDRFFQRWVPGRSFGATFLNDGVECQLLGVCRSFSKRLGPFPFVYSGSFGPIKLSSQTQAAVSMVGRSVIKQVPIRGLFNVDLIIDPSGKVWLIEVNARWSGSSEIIERCLRDTGVLNDVNGSLFELHWRAAHGDRINSVSFPSGQSQAVQTQFAKRIVFTYRSGKLATSALIKVSGTDDSAMNVEIKDVPLDEFTALERYEPIATVIWHAPTTAKPTWRKEKRLLAKIQEAVR